MATAKVAPNGADDELEMEVMLEDDNPQQASEEAGEGEGGHEDGQAGHRDEGSAEEVQEGRLAEGGEAEGEGEVKTAKPNGDAEKPDHKKTRRQRNDQYRRAAQRMREERDYLLQQNAEIIQRLAQVENSALENRLLTIDGRLQECNSDADQALTLETQALQQGDQESIRSARQIREKALSRANVLQQERDRLQQAISSRGTTSAPRYQPPMPGQAEVNNHAARFKADKPWLQFRQDGSPANRETAVYHAIDLAMQAEGRYVASDPTYWSELDRRGRAALPHLFGEDDEGAGEEVELGQSQTQRQAPPVQRANPAGKAVAKGPAVAGSGRQANAGSTSNRLSPAQVDALRDMGLWGPNLTPAEKKEQADYIKYFQRAVRENA